MPTAVTERPYRPVPADPPRKRWTRAECAAFEATGLWGQQHLELIEGELIDRKMGKNRPHASTLAVVNAWMIRVFGERYVNSETSIDVAPEDNPTSEPEPDIIVLARPTFEITKNPQPPEIRLVIEISDSTLGFDLTIKAGLYARAGISEYWVFDIPAHRLIVHRDPRNGMYTSVAAYRPEEAVAPLAAPEHEFLVRDAFPG
jgi:Uma2 family endonuclease